MIFFKIWSWFQFLLGFSIDLALAWTATTGGESIARNKTYSASSRVTLDETVADGQTDKQVTVALDVSAVKAFYIVSDQSVTLETNSGSAPDDTISLVAGVPYWWSTDSYDTFQLGTDVTAFFFTNASGATATIKMEAIQDATP